MAHIDDYWDEVVAQMIESLIDFQDLFPKNFIKIKGVKEEVGVIKLQLKDDTKLLWKRPYRLNNNMKKIKTEIEKTLVSEIIKSVEDVE